MATIQLNMDEKWLTFNETYQDHYSFWNHLKLIYWKFYTFSMIMRDQCVPDKCYISSATF